MPLKQSLTADEHGALPEAERGNYKLVGTNYVPDVEGIDNLPGLASALDRERQRANDLDKALKPFSGLTAERVQQLLDLEKSQNIGKLTSKGEFDAAREQIEKDANQRVSDAEQRARNVTIDYKLDQALIKAGVIPERLEVAKMLARQRVKLMEDDSLSVVGPDGKVSGTTLDKFLSEDFKTQNAYLYQPNGGAGTGAQPGTKANLGAGVQTKTRAEFAALSAQEKIDFSNLVAQKKAQLVA